ncbi:hypothetical protein EOL96_03285 [Candidatus Saccharibacteria bacterium]|nr:hypothetical protein [Candidatus Saccharibacteria bacterium]
MVKNVIEEPVAQVRVSPLVGMSIRDMVGTLVVGLFVGLVVAGVAYLMNLYVFGAVLCRPQSPTECSQAPAYAMVVAMVIGAIVGIVGLVKLRVYRPLLIVLAATISLWGLHTLVDNMAWYIAFPIMTILFGLVYALFAWIARVRSFVLTIVLAVVMVVVIRWMLVA